MIVTHKKRLIKRLPDKYMVIDNITDYLEDFEHIRLSAAERKHLDNARFRKYFDDLIEYLKEDDPELYTQVKDSVPMYAVKFKANGQRTIFIIRTNNNISLKCTKLLYELCPNKRTNATQLTLFES